MDVGATGGRDVQPFDGQDSFAGIEKCRRHDRKLRRCLIRRQLYRLVLPCPTTIMRYIEPGESSRFGSRRPARGRIKETQAIFVPTEWQCSWGGIIRRF